MSYLENSEVVNFKPKKANEKQAKLDPMSPRRCCATIFAFFFRLMLGLAAVPSIVMFFGCLVLPESPRWLVSKGYSERAKKVLVKLRGTTDVSSELGAMKNVCDEEESFQKNSKCSASLFSFKIFQ